VAFPPDGAMGNDDDIQHVHEMDRTKNENKHCLESSPSRKLIQWRKTSQSRVENHQTQPTYDCMYSLRNANMVFLKATLGFF